MKYVQNMDTNRFFREVIKSPNPVMVDFWRPSCAPCKILNPHLEYVAQAYEGKLKVYKMNVDKHAGIASKYNVRGLPTILFFKNGHPYDQITGAVSRSKILNVVKSII